MKKGSLLLLFLLCACQNQGIESTKIEPMSLVQTMHALPVLGGQYTENFSVTHHVKGNQVYVECIVPNMSFRDGSKEKGKIILYVDGVKKEEITTAAFIIKGLPSGNHHIKLDVIASNAKRSPMSQEFTISIP